jgi:uncharacterized membrane protein
LKGTGNHSSYWVKVLNGMGLGLFSSLIVGLMLKQIGAFAGIGLLVKLGTVAQYMMGPAIAGGIARGIDAPPLAIFSVLAVGAMGAGTFSGGSPAAGEPIGAAVAAVVGAQVGKMIQSKRSIDILLIPLGTIIAGSLAGVFFAPYATKLMNWLGALINTATTLHPFMMGIIISAVMGVLLTLPISSAALAVSLGLSGLAAGAATVGCSCQMIGFAVMSFRENGVGGLVSQGLGTSMLQMPNIIQNPWIWLPPTLTSAILGPVTTMVFKMRNSSVGAGMGTSGLVGQVGTFAVMGQAAWPGVILLHFVLPAIMSYVFAEALRKRHLIGASDMTLKTE